MPYPRPDIPFFAEEIRPGLQGRTLGGLVDLKSRSWRAILLRAGEVSIEEAGEARAFAGPCLLWLPHGGGEARFRLRAGSAGAHLLMGEATLANAIGVKPESAALRVFSARAYHLALADAGALQDDIERCFDLINREAAAPAPGSATITEAQVRVLLVLLWRNLADDPLSRGPQSPAALILLRFRQALETHFRDRWSVARYADELGVSPDRLHDLCSRNLGRAPQRLIHERLAHEGRVLLERSPQTLEQIAAYLGFPSAAQFNAFFKAHHGMPPGAYRRRAAATREGEGLAVPSYADWP